MIFWALLKAEWTKTMRMRTTYIAFLAVALLVGIIQLGLYFMPEDDMLVRSFRAFDFPLSWIINGYTITQVTLVVAFTILIAPLTIMTFSRQVAGETAAGTLRLVLSRPVSRFALLNAKFIVCMAYSMLLMGFLFTFSYGLGTALFGWSESISVPDRRELLFTNLSPEFQQMNDAEGGDSRRFRRRVPQFDYRGSMAGRVVRDSIEAQLKSMLISPWQCMGRLALAWLLTSWALFTLGALAFLYSTLNRYSIAAMALTLGTFFIVLIIQQLASLEALLIPLFTSIEPYLFTKAMGFWSACFKAQIAWGEMWGGFWLLGVYTLAFHAIAQYIFWRRDITS